jgi:hypothetical protein
MCPPPKAALIVTAGVPPRLIPFTKRIVALIINELPATSVTALTQAEHRR